MIHRFACVFLIGVVACGHATPTLGPITETPVTVTFTDPIVGSRSTDTLEYHVDLTVGASVSGHSASRHIHGDGRTVSTQEVLSVHDHMIDKLRVGWVESSMTTKADDEDAKEDVDPRNGKTYLVEVTDGLLAIHPEAGDMLPDETKRLRKDLKWLTTQKAPAVLGPKTFTVGASAGETLYPNLLGEANRLGIEVSRADLVYRGQTKDAAVFDIDFDIENEGASGAKASLTLHGQIGLRIADGRPNEFAGSGKLSFSASSKSAEISGDGTFDGHFTREQRNP
jgi:hypothetical protein